MSKLVTTISGNLVNKELCKLIQKEYYQMNVDCFLINDKWYRATSDKIVFNYDINGYSLRSPGIMYGIVKHTINEKGQHSFEEGHFFENRFKNIKFLHITSSGSTYEYVAMNMDIFKCKLVKSKSIDFYLLPNADADYEESKNFVSEYNLNLLYNAEFSLKGFTEIYEDALNVKKNYVINPYVKKYLSNLSFGVEYETRQGRLLSSDCYKHGLIPLKDGSLRHHDLSPYEYASIVLDTPEKLMEISNHCDILNESCGRSINESLHLHIGGIKIDKAYIVTLYTILLNVQNELFRMFPEKISRTSLFKEKGKDYCKMLPQIFNSNHSIDTNFNLIYMYLTGGLRVEDQYMENENEDSDEHYDEDEENDSEESEIEMEDTQENDSEENIPIKTSVASEIFEALRATAVTNMFTSTNTAQIVSEPIPVPAPDYSNFSHLERKILELRDRMESGNYVRATASVKDVNDGTFKDDFVFGKPHPLDRDNAHKWNINSRYHIVNFNPLFFGNNKTVEFRCHTNTFNKHKIIHWIFITSAIVKYASLNRGKSIGSISLQEILRKIYSDDEKLYTSLTAYYKGRIALMREYNFDHFDTYGFFDVLEDKMPNKNYINFYE